MCIALFAAAITCCLVKPGREYFTYFDWKTLSCLYCVLAVVGALVFLAVYTTVLLSVLGVI